MSVRLAVATVIALYRRLDQARPVGFWERVAIVARVRREDQRPGRCVLRDGRLQVTRHGFALFAWWRVIVGTVGLIGLALFG